MTITLNEAVYDGLYRTVAERKTSQFIEDLLKPLVLDSSLDGGYKAMASDTPCEAKAAKSCKAPSSNAAHETR